MSELHWSKKTPFKDGWYWWRENISAKPEIVEIFWLQVVNRAVEGSVLQMGGQWYGPLQEPGGDAIENCQEPQITGCPQCLGRIEVAVEGVARYRCPHCGLLLTRETEGRTT